MAFDNLQFAPPPTKKKCNETKSAKHDEAKVVDESDKTAAPLSPPHLPPFAYCRLTPYFGTRSVMRDEP